MPPKRAADAHAETENNLKKLRSAVDGMADEWVCPITFELPLDPVIAEDGRTYERSAIEEVIRTQGAGLRSPITNKPMGARLTASLQLRNTIEKLVRSGAIVGDKAERWTAWLAAAEEVKAERLKAEGGDARAMCRLGLWYDNGLKGLTQDASTAYAWFKRGAETAEGTKGQVICLASMGVALLSGLGVEQNALYGMALLLDAAHMGSDCAACDLGDYFYEGKHGLPKDAGQAKKWYAKVATNQYKHCNAPGITKAAERVLELSR